jgi:multiple sugar transport system substrate-binding protein
MRRLRFSVAQSEYFTDAVSFFKELSQPELEALDAELAVEPVPWEKLWYIMQTQSLARSGLDVSEVGTTWLGSLADADALRTFSEDDVKRVGDKATFTTTSWKLATLLSDNRVLSIPWLADTRVVYYWRDMLERADVDETEAFRDVDTTVQTMERLRANGRPGWGAPTFACNNNVHYAASWIWAKGKDFVSPDGRRTTFCDPEAIEGIASYYQLSQYMPRTFNTIKEVVRSF